MSLPDLVVFSHLRWGFVYQRPQHLLSRLARHWRVWFIEEPVHDDGPARLSLHRHDGQDGPNGQRGVTVVVPHTPVAAPGFHDDQIAALQPLLAQLRAQQGIDAPVAWLYTPMALPLMQAFEPVCVAYDCIDELASFKDAPRQLRQRERALMKSADIVFTGGPSLFEAKRGLHPNVHCVPSSVDAAHFAPGLLDWQSDHGQQAQALQGHLPRPRLGFYGVIDERMDLALVRTLAESHPDWQIVMAGPVVKIDAAALPRRDNLHWLGMQPYERLPYLLAGWDICLMPFAINEATRFISPTKTLEYMAGEKPVVSTAINDVLQLYGHAVHVTADPQAFVQACETVWQSLQAGRCPYADAMLMTVSSQSWDYSAEAVHGLLHQAAAKGLLLRQPVAQGLPRPTQDCAQPLEPLVALAGAQA